MAELANCSRCGAVYVKALRDICQDCYTEEERAFQAVYSFLLNQNNRKATRTDIIDATGIEDWYITKFIREKRLLLSKFPNLSYPCETCGTGITSGKLCQDCQESIIKDLKREEELEMKAERYKKTSSVANTYYTLDKKNRK
ncbi:TIGR03826 family flagellar region protein [Oceanobacillus sp. Castelsardo]|uniref:TIGR03826 family flagellar region protein n=1 Tax=Oceanobacillus sp. Castelsardo TaxID=1851204 RepID=UPI00083896F1|nr:TIGR03826 family flagellar region protein [Oceanobacillus sp. Castelsardo]